MGAKLGRGRRRLLAAATTSGIAVLLLGCGAGARPTSLERGVALWLEPGMDGETVRALAAEGLDHFWIRLDSDEAGGRIVPQLPLPRGSRVTLLTALGAAEAEGARGRGLARRLGRLVLDVENRGATVLGLAFERAHGLEAAVFGEWVGVLRKELGAPPRAIAVLHEGPPDEELMALAAAVDFVLVPLYGQAPGEADRSRRWDLLEAERAATALAEAGLPFRALFHLGGSASLQAEDGPRPVPLPTSELLRLASTADAQFDFEGFYRQRFLLRTELGASLRVSRPTLDHVHGLLQRLEAAGGDRWLGALLATPAGADSALGVRLSHLRFLGDRRPPSPSVGVEPGARRGTVRVTLALEPEGVPTAIASREHNYVDLVLEDGRFDDVELGDFTRVEYRRRGAAPNEPGSVRQADSLRLFFRFLEPGMELSTGDLEIRGVSEARRRLSAELRYLRPQGDEVRIVAADPDAQEAGERAAAAERGEPEP